MFKFIQFFFHCANLWSHIYIYIVCSKKFGAEELRISCHQLQIKTGRYQGTLLQDRKCDHCSSGEVEDEYHFLFHCNKLENDRNLLVLLKEIAKSCPNFKRLNSKDKLVWLMNRGKISPHYYSNIYSKEHEIAWLSFLFWTRDLHITVPWASSLGVLSWNETSTVTINMLEYDSLFLFYIFKQNN